MEVVKFQQAIFIHTDLDMYHSETNTKAIARTSNLIEELGRVRNMVLAIFSIEEFINVYEMHLGTIPVFG
jgi:hypothetical protein